MASLAVRHFAGFAALPASYAPLLAQAAAASFFNDRVWFEFVMRHLFDEHHELRIYAVEHAKSGEPLLVAPLRYTRYDGAAPYAQALATVSHAENFCPLRLIFAPAAGDRGALLTTLFSHLRRGGATAEPRRFDVLRISPVEVGSELAALVRASLRRSGFWVQTYANSFNRFERTAGIDFATYFAQRSANHRYNVRRRERSLAKRGAVAIRIVTDENDLSAAVADYVAVARASWKAPEFMISLALLHLIRLAASRGCLRLGILRLDGRPVAAQFWIVTGGTGHCIRLAYDEAYKGHAVGVVLTSAMIAHMLDRDHVETIDFGYGEEDYKASWMRDCRDYAGYMAFNPATRRGLAFGLRHIVGRPLKRGVKRLLAILAQRRGRAGTSPGSH